MTQRMTTTETQTNFTQKHLIICVATPCLKYMSAQRFQSYSCAEKTLSVFSITQLTSLQTFGWWHTHDKYDPYKPHTISHKMQWKGDSLFPLEMSRHTEIVKWKTQTTASSIGKERCWLLEISHQDSWLRHRSPKSEQSLVLGNS